MIECQADEDFSYEVRKLNLRWQEPEVRIDSRGIASGQHGHSPQKVTGWIRTKGSRHKFDEAIRKLGPKGTVESILLRPEFAEIAAVYPEAAEKAKGRLLGQRDD